MKPSLRNLWATAAALGLVATAGTIAVHQLGTKGQKALPRLPSGHLVRVPGQKLVTVHGLTIRVPDSWPVRVGTPCVLAANQVMLPATSSLDCGPGRVKGITTIGFDDESIAHPDRQTNDAIDGVPVDRESSTDAFASYVNIIVPRLAVAVRIGAPTAGQAKKLAATLQVTDVDANGCRSTAGNTTSLNALPNATRPGSEHVLIPANPTSIRVCRYQSGWLEQSATIPSGQLDRFVATLNAQPSGLSRADHRGITCRSGGAGATDPTAQAAPDSESYVIQASYPVGPAVTVLVRLGWCGDLGASNGTRTAQRTPELIAAVTTEAGRAHG